ncbi:MAG: hypothetical protein AMS14_10290, partial [Planctomycetes bacterium DG_20]
MLAVFATLLQSAVHAASDYEEFQVKREQVFEFAEKPSVRQSGDRVEIRFETKGFCDVTVAIEDAAEKGTLTSGYLVPFPRIVRHLASGVLGPNAPGPFQKDSKKQVIVWDSKNDKGEYVESKDPFTVRVSLGLKPRFERTLFWSPHKRIGILYPVIRAAQEGVYVCEGYAVDHVRLFDHQGNYLRTIYPFPADKIEKVFGLQMHRFIQNGTTLPLKQGYHQATLLTCGSNNNTGSSAEGYGVSALAARNGRLALVHLKLNRLRSDGSSGAMQFEGPRTGIHIPKHAGGFGYLECDTGPLSAAMSPDGKWVYMTGYQFTAQDTRTRGWLNGVGRVAYEGDDAVSAFAGSLEPAQTPGGTADGQFRVPTSVACDAQGRVYVANYMNDRLQVFDPAGKHLKTIAVSKPASVAIHRKTGDIFVFSWFLSNRFIGEERVEPVYTHLGPFEDPRVKTKCPLPLTAHGSTGSWNAAGGIQHRVELDSWTE